MCNENKNNNSSIFIIGLILGAIIAGAIVLTSADDKVKIVKKIKNKFNELFKNKIEPIIEKEEKEIKKVTKKIIKRRRDVARYVSTNIVEPVKKISVDIPSDVETLNLTPVKTVKSKKVFKKSKKI